MAELWSLIEAHLDHYGVTGAAFARKCGTTAQTIQNWKNRPTTLPKPHHLRAVARVIGMPYPVVLNAALVDAGYRDAVLDDTESLHDELGAIADRSNEALHEIAERLFTELGW